jgi:hypothetical protein
LEMAASGAVWPELTWVEHWITPEVIAKMTVGGRRSLLHEIDCL